MKMSVKSALAPPGQHTTTLDRIEPTETCFGASKRWVEGWRWVFRVVSGDHADTELSVVTGREMRLGNRLGELINQMYGRTIQPGEEIDPIADLVGHRFDVFAIPAGDGDGAIISKVTPITTEKE